MRKRSASTASSQSAASASTKPKKAHTHSAKKSKSLDIKEIEKRLPAPELLPSLETLSKAKLTIGYPCMNWSLGLTTGHTLRLNAHSRERVFEAVKQNLHDLEQMVDFNIKYRVQFLRIGSGMVPFASHQVGAKVDWEREFSERLKALGARIKSAKIRISMHPDQFVLLNSPKSDVHDRSVAELDYHCRLLDAMGLGRDAKVQIHVGGVYGDKSTALQTFEKRYRELSTRIRTRLVIENDDRLFSLQDCLQLHKAVGVPVLFDNLHHECLNNCEPLLDAVKAAAATWKEADGRLMMDYSSQEPGARKGKHASTLNEAHFSAYLRAIRGCEADIMLEIKDKEVSALRALQLLGAQLAISESDGGDVATMAKRDSKLPKVA